MRKILIDFSSLLSLKNKITRAYPTGIERVVLAYLVAYKERAQLAIYLKRFEKFIILPQPVSKKIIEHLSPWNSASSWKINWLVFRYGILEYFRKRDFSDCIFIKSCAKKTKNSRYYERLKKLNVKIITLIHDLTLMENIDHVFSAKSVQYYQQFIHQALKYSDAIITTSRIEHDKLLHYAAQINQSCPAMRCSGLAPNLCDTTSRGPRLIEKTYFVMIGSLKIRRKNHALLLNIWRELVAQQGVSAPRLIIVGAPGKKGLQSLPPNVMQCAVDDETLVNYLSHARALLLPSLAEGYGLPLVEALSLGTPVIANDLPVFHEVANDVPDYIAVTDEQKWLAFIVDYAKDNSILRQAQLDRIKNFVAPTWEEHFERIEEWVI